MSGGPPTASDEMSSMLPRECQRLREWLPEYAEGMSAGRRRGRLERHVAGCPRCAQEVADLRAVVRVVRSAQADPLPQAVLAEIRQAVARRAAPRPVPVWQWRLLAPAAAVAVLAVFALAFHGRMRGEHYGMAGPQLMAKASQEQVTPPAEPAPAAASESDVGQELGVIEAAPPAAEALESEPVRRAGRPIIPSLTSPQPKRVHPSPVYARVRSASGPAARSGGPPILRLDLRPHNGGAGHRGEGGRGDGAGGGGAPGDRLRRGRDRVAVAEVPKPATGPVELASLRESRCEAVAAPQVTAAKAGPVAPELSLRVVVEEGAERPTVAFGVSAEPKVRRVAVYADTPRGRELLWSGKPVPDARVPVSPQHIGPGPAAVPIVVESDSGVRHYILFVPTLARLGQVSEGSPVGRYRGETVGQVLRDLSTLTGLVLLAEGPLNRPVEGGLRAGEPSEVLSWFAGQAGLQVHADGELARTLTHPR